MTGKKRMLRHLKSEFRFNMVAIVFSGVAIAGYLLPSKHPKPHSELLLNMLVLIQVWVFMRSLFKCMTLANHIRKIKNFMPIHQLINPSNVNVYD